MPQFLKDKQVFVLKKYFERKRYIEVKSTSQQWFNHAPLCKKTVQQNLINTVHMEWAWIKTKEILEDEGPLVLKRTLNKNI